VLTADGGTITPKTLDSKFGMVPGQVAPAKPVEIAAPSLTFVKLADGRLQLTMVPPTGAEEYSMDLRTKSALKEMQVGGEAFAASKPSQWTHLRFAALPKGGSVSFSAAEPGELEVRFSATIDGWPQEAVALPQRDATLMPWDRSDSAIAVGTRRFSW